MIASTMSCAMRGLTGVPVTVEADIANGLPQFSIVGLTDRSIQEARERVRAAIRNAGFEFPMRRVTVNLAPAEVPKEGTGFDLSIAVALLGAGRPALRKHDHAFIGELALDGRLRPVIGVLPMVRCLQRAGIRSVAVPVENAAEAALVTGIAVIAVPSLRACVEHVDGTTPLDAAGGGAAPAAQPAEDADLQHIRGQPTAKRALEIAAAGRHNILMIGPPGSGKTMLARAGASLLPDLTEAAALEVAAIYSLRGALGERPPTAVRPPFRSPHHSVSRAGLIGGGIGMAQPGEVTLAHHGILFLDEVCEFPRTHLEALRQPLEERIVAIGRARGTVVLPAGFMLVGATNPCPCGRLGEPRGGCRCPARDIARYSARVSGPVQDRIDLIVNVPRQAARELFEGADEEPSSAVRARVIEAQRFRAHAGRPNQPDPIRSASRATAGGEAVRRLIDEYRLTEEARRLLFLAGDRLRLSARGFCRVLRVSRTISDLAAEPEVAPAALAEALRYRGESFVSRAA